MKIEIKQTGLSCFRRKKTEPNMVGSVRFKNFFKNNFDLVIYFNPKLNQTKKFTHLVANKISSFL